MLPNRRGVFVFSLDLELAWGAVHRRGYAGRERDFEKTRFVVGELLAMFERHRVQATWAVVGHLLLDACKPEQGRKHPEIVRPEYGTGDFDWFDRDPCSNVDEDPHWYAPDIIRSILDCREPQEIGSHNFSHVMVIDGCSKESLASELKASESAAKRWDLELRSFVFPRNAVGHLDTVASAGYRAFRGVSSDWTSRMPRLLRRPARFVDAFWPGAVASSMPVRQSGMWNIPASYNYLHRSGWGRLVPVSVRVRKSISGLQDAASRGGVFHLWTHPFNLASDPEPLLAGLDEVFHAYAALRDSGLIANATMGELASTLGVAGADKSSDRPTPVGIGVTK